MFLCFCMFLLVKVCVRACVCVRVCVVNLHTDMNRPSGSMSVSHDLLIIRSIVK